MTDTPTLAAILQAEESPTKYVGHGHELDNGITPHLRAFGAGAVDPFGFPSRLMRLYADNAPTALSPISQEDAKAYRQTMRNARDESPIMGGAGSGAALLYPLSRLLGWGVASGAPLVGAQISKAFDEYHKAGSPEDLENQRQREIDRAVELGAKKDRLAKNSPQSAMFWYGGNPPISQIDAYGNRKGDMGVPPLPDAPY